MYCVAAVRPTRLRKTWNVLLAHTLCGERRGLLRGVPQTTGDGIKR